MKIRIGTEYLDVKYNENTAYQNLWDAAKVVFKREIYSIKYFFLKKKKV